MRRIKLFNEKNFTIRRTTWDDDPKNLPISPDLINSIFEISLPFIDNKFEFKEQYLYIGGHKLEYVFTLTRQFKTTQSDALFKVDTDKQNNYWIDSFEERSEVYKFISENIGEFLDRLGDFKNSWEVGYISTNDNGNNMQIRFKLTQR